MTKTQTSRTQSRFSGKWPIENSYTITPDGFIRTKPSNLPKELIDPGSFSGIAMEFSQVQTAPQLCVFVSKYGLLGYGRLFPDPKRKTEDPVQEPVTWCLSHARRVAAAFDIFDLIKRGERVVRSELPKVLRSAKLELFGDARAKQHFTNLFINLTDLDPKRTKDAKTGRLITDAMTGNVKPGIFADGAWPHDPLRVAWRILSHLISDQIRGLRLELSEEELQPVFTYRALLEVIYWQLAEELQGLHLHVCQAPGCGRFFRAKRVDARSCGPACRKKLSRAKKERKIRMQLRKRGV